MFSANVSIEEAEVGPYVAPWLESNQSNIFIGNGGSRTLKLADYGHEGWIPPVVGETQIYWIQFSQFTANGLRPIESARWITDGRLKPGPQPVTVNVDILTDPPAASPCIHRYELILRVAKRIIEVREVD